MDFAIDEPREDRLIEDYLFTGYRASSRQHHDPDHQFAKPIQDEDIFAVQADNDKASTDKLEEDLGRTTPTDTALLGFQDEESLGIGGFNIRESSVLSDREVNASPSRLFDDDDVVELEQTVPCKQYISSKATNLDDVFLDDYSESSYPDNNENVQPRVDQESTTSAASILAKKALFLAKLKEQAKALAIKPKPIEKSIVETHSLEFVIEQDRLVSDTQSKFIFNKIFNNSKKARDSNGTPERKVKCWNDYRNTLTKRICSQKRKIWDSLNKASSCIVDEEEEFVVNELEEESRSENNDGTEDDDRHEDEKKSEEREVDGDGDAAMDSDDDLVSEESDAEPYADEDEIEPDSEEESGRREVRRLVDDEAEDADLAEDDYSDLDVFDGEDSNADQNKVCPVEEDEVM